MPHQPLLVALDVPDIASAETLVRTLHPHVGGFKIGLELFNAAGPEIFARVREIFPEARLFYDAKFHDIPNTVAGAVRAGMRHRLWMVNVHASGGKAMMAAAVDSAHQSPAPPLVIAVTVLTSLDQAMLSTDLGIARLLTDQVVALAQLAQDAGCDGVVASPHEIRSIKEACGPDFLVVTPGVRPAGSAIGDQKRVLMPREAMDAGADYLVIGRPITAAPDPASAARAILREMNPV